MSSKKVQKSRPKDLRKFLQPEREVKTSALDVYRGKSNKLKQRQGKMTNIEKKLLHMISFTVVFAEGNSYVHLHIFLVVKSER